MKRRKQGHRVAGPSIHVVCLQGERSHGIVGLDPRYFVDPDLLKGIGIDFLIFLSSLLYLVVDL